MIMSQQRLFRFPWMMLLQEVSLRVGGSGSENIELAGNNNTHLSMHRTAMLRKESDLPPRVNVAGGEGQRAIFTISLPAIYYSLQSPIGYQHLLRFYIVLMLFRSNMVIFIWIQLELVISS